jgi:hypothetical protein
MNNATKLKLVKLTVTIILLTIAGILIWFFGLILTLTFDLNVFDKGSMGFMASILGGAFVLAACSALLNLVLNLSIIAEKSVTAEEKNEPSRLNYKSAIIFGGALIITAAFLFIGDHLSRDSFKKKLTSEVHDIIVRYPKSIEKIGTSIQDKKTLHEIPSILSFLSKLKHEFPSVIMITSGSINSEKAFLRITPYTHEDDMLKPAFNNSFYECGKKDCDYLEKIFSGKTNEKYFWNDNDNYFYYIPISSGDKTFILLFSKLQRYGKIGSDSMRK